MRWNGGKTRGTSRVYIVSYDGHTTRVGPDAAPSPLPRLARDAPPPQLHASTHAQKYTRARAWSAQLLCNVVVWQRPSAVPPLHGFGWRPPPRRRRDRVHVVHFILRSFAAVTGRRRWRRAPFRERRTVGVVLTRAYSRAAASQFVSSCVLLLFTTRVARAVRVRCSIISHPFVFVSFTATHHHTSSNTFRLRVLEDRTRSVFDMETRFSPFPNHVNALSGTTLRRPFFYCPTVRHYHTMYRYNAAGIVLPKYWHSTTAATTTTTTSSSSSTVSNFLYTNRLLFIASACIDRRE